MLIAERRRLIAERLQAAGRGVGGPVEFPVVRQQHRAVRRRDHGLLHLHDVVR